MTKGERVGDERAGRSAMRSVLHGGGEARPGGWLPARPAVLGFLLLAAFGLGCSASDSGGMSGTGISQGSIDSFGSIFVNGVEWETDDATIQLDGQTATEADLRLGMVVRIEGERSGDGLTGNARRVEFDDSIEGPIENTPVETVPGVQKTFTILGQTVVADAVRTRFADGATFAGLAMDDVVEVSGFVDAAGAVQATRIQAKPLTDRVELRGEVASLVKNPDGTGDFALGTITIYYDETTAFDDLSRSTLAEGDFVEVEGNLRLTGDQVDATEIEAEDEGIGADDSDDADVEGIVVLCPQSPDYCVSGVPVDDSGATYEPVGFMPMPGDRVECEGRLENGVLIATKVESKDDEDNPRDVRIAAAVTSLNVAARTLVILGVTITADGDTVLEDDSDVDDETLTFAELQVGDYLEIEAASTGPAAALAISIERDDAEAGDDDVRLEGPVTALDPNLPALTILGQSIPLDAGTEYRDGLGQIRTEEEFFRNPGDVALGDIVRARDQDAADLAVLGESDEVEIESGDGDDG